MSRSETQFFTFLNPASQDCTYDFGREAAETLNFTSDFGREASGTLKFTFDFAKCAKRSIALTISGAKRAKSGELFVSPSHKIKINKLNVSD